MPSSRALEFEDHRKNPAAWASALGISTEAVQLYLACDVIDLHIDTFIWARAVGYDLTRRHGRGLLNARYYGMVDFPRVREAALTGGMWSITTNPLRSSRGRARTLLRNLERFKGLVASVPDDFAVCRTLSDYRAAKASNRHAVFLSVQGGNALDQGEEVVARAAPDLVRVTLVHLSNSTLGASSVPAPGRREKGLTPRGREMVRWLNAHRVLVDLAHIHRDGFFDAVAVHDPTQPLVVTHTGVCGAHPHWRNLDDEQLLAIAKTGGTVGIVYHCEYLGGGLFGGPSSLILDHAEHVIRTVGEDHCSLGSDWDGTIAPPRDMPTCLELPRLVQQMLERGWSAERIRKVLGGNFLRVLGAIRP